MSNEAIDAMTPEARALCLEIHEAFATATYPGDDRIVYDSSGAHLECAAIKEKLNGRHWRDLPFEALLGLRSALSFLTPEAYRFYLPAFLLLTIVDFYGSDVLVDEIVHSLTLPDEADIAKLRDAMSASAAAPPLPPREWASLLDGLAAMHQSGEPSRRFLERVAHLTAAQAHAIFAWLSYMRDFHGEEFPTGAPEQAIERYWGALAA